MASKFEDLVAYRLAADLADALWPVVLEWPSFARWSLGKQLIRSADSVGANIAEATGRRTSADRRYFFAVARGSALLSSISISISPSTGGGPESSLMVSTGVSAAKPFRFMSPQPVLRRATSHSPCSRHQSTSWRKPKFSST